MCGRYYIADKDLLADDLAEAAEAAASSPLSARFLERLGRAPVTEGEVKPQDIAPVFAPDRSGHKAVYPMRWGFTLPASGGMAGSGRLIINARSETAADRPLFRDAWHSRRCIVPASGYFEWAHYTDENGRRRTGAKYRIQASGQLYTCLCGLYRIEDGLPVFVILTRAPSKELAAIHDRMPLILPAEAADAWLYPGSDPDALLQNALTETDFEKLA